MSGSQYSINYKDSQNRNHMLTIASIGSSIRKYTIDNLDIVTPYEADTIPEFFQGQVLFPWANRLQDGQYDFEGNKIQTGINEIDKNNQLHSLSPFYSFRLINKKNDLIELGLHLPPQKGYPFNVEVKIEYKFINDKLNITSQIKNLGLSNAPFMMGWHPWFSVRGNMDNAFLEFEAQYYIKTNERLISQAEISVPEKFNFSQKKSLKNIALDDAFLDVKNNTIKLTGADKHITIIKADKSYKAWQICNADFAVGKNYKFGVAIEPMTAYANAFKTGKNLIILKPKQKLKNSWSVKFE
ncbi:MAG: hypothetical protein LBT91_03855 [Bifidobacteriaceae bacterium]|nr:hypothetical protein [Bifidobacteriaceae bacterium]